MGLYFVTFLLQSFFYSNLYSGILRDSYFPKCSVMSLLQSKIKQMRCYLSSLSLTLYSYPKPQALGHTILHTCLILVQCPILPQRAGMAINSISSQGLFISWKQHMVKCIVRPWSSLCSHFGLQLPVTKYTFQSFLTRNPYSTLYTPQFTRNLCYQKTR